MSQKHVRFQPDDFIALQFRAVNAVRKALIADFCFLVGTGQEVQCCFAGYGRCFLACMDIVAELFCEDV